ncbi:MAG: type II and III secretion system protein family protein, partial [Limisphaerales bacterium]
VDARQNVLVNDPVMVTRDIAPIQEAINRVVGNGHVDVQAIDGSVMLDGTVASAEQADEVRRLTRPFVGDDSDVINRLKVDAPIQVNLRVRVAEISHQVIKELGFNWDTLGHVGSFPLGVATGAPVIGVPTGTNGQLLPLAPSVAAAGTIQGAFQGAAATAGGFFTRNPAAGALTDSILAGMNAGRFDINSVIDALDQHGLVKVLAEPNLTAMTGETASFLAGGEFPILVPQTLGQVTVEFKQFGVQLSFTPVVLAGGRISLRVRPEVSELSTTGQVQLNGYTIPGISTRRAETTVELGSGQSFAIGGLMQNDVTDTIKKLPGLGNLPILGALFRSDQFQRNESELVIVVTPYLVTPSSQRLALPTDGYTAPTDRDRIEFGRDHHSTDSPPAPQASAAPTGK